MGVISIPEKAIMKLNLSQGIGNYNLYNLNPNAELKKFDLMATGVNAFQEAYIKDLRVIIEYSLKNE